MQHTFDVAIIGAAFSGSLLAIQIFRRHAGARIFLIEKAPQFGRGVAYGAAGPEHLLNVRASNMSAFPEDPDHFIAWLRTHAPDGVEPRSFVSRQLYGSYLQSILGKIVGTEQGAGRLVTVADEAVAVTLDATRPRVRLAVGRNLDVDHVVLACGNLPPHDLPPFADADAAIYTSDPWAGDAFAHVRPDDEVLLIGTGLTAVDMILKIEAAGHHGVIRALSRRGLRPHRHYDRGPAMVECPLPSRPSLTGLLRLVRDEARRKGWREAVDGLRPNIQRLWREASEVERRRFLRHLRPWWDIHRHRLAPDVADRIEALERAGRLTFAAGRIESVRYRDDKAEVTWTARKKQEGETIVVDRIVNCIGPAGDFTKSTSPLLRGLIERGLARPDACSLGLDVDEDCRLVDARGEAQPRLRAMGQISRGAFWEIIAVPDIRVQAARIAALLTAP